MLLKFTSFIERFPSFESLADAQLGDVLREWSGLGYNRRAKFLWLAAQEITNNGFPKTVEELVKLPGIGLNTAGAVVAYVYDQPVVFIETNIRTVFLHHFFKTETKVADSEIYKHVAAAVPTSNVRQWYWALMDYGTFLKSTAGTQLQKVAQYKKQSVFKGSNRQVRGQVIKMLAENKMSRDQLDAAIDDPRLASVLNALMAEDLIKKSTSDLFWI